MEQVIQNAAYAMLRIGDKTQEFKAVTTQGDIDFPSKYSGSRVMLLFHLQVHAKQPKTEWMEKRTVLNARTGFSVLKRLLKNSY